MKNPQKLLIANWKMHKTAEDVEVYFAKFLEQFFKMKELETQDSSCLCGSLCSPCPLSKSFAFHQDWVRAEPPLGSKGAYTGEISPAMLTDVGVAM